MLIGKYRLDERIGAGGYGEVWRGWLEGEQGFRKPVAVKLLKDTTGEHATQFFNEARIGAALKHPNIVDVYEFVRIDEQYVLAMELVDGETLESLVARHPDGLPPEQVVDLMRQITSALNYAHALKDENGVGLGLVHRDLKPGNVMIDRNGIVKVLDFGIAVFRTASRTTGPGVAKGTLCYMAPEQIEAEQVTQAIDLWALGAIAYELATGRHLVPPGDLLQAVLQISDLDEKAVGRVVGARVPQLQPLVEGCLKSSPAERWTAAMAHASLSTGPRWTPGPAPDRAPGASPAPLKTNSEERLRRRRDAARSQRPPTPRAAEPRAAAPRRGLTWWEIVMLPSGLLAALLAIGAGIGLLGLAGSLAGWGALTYDPDGPATGGTLRVAYPRTRGALDPYARTTTLGALVLPAALEGLVGLDRDGRPVPGPIASWTEEGNTLLLALRPDVWFHPHPCATPDGRLATPEDVRFSLRWAYDRGKLPRDIRSISVADDGRVAITLKAPSPFLVRDLAGIALLPVQLPRCETLDDLRQPVGTGPFRFTGPVDGDALALSRHEKYWRTDATGRPLPYLDGLVASPMTAEEALGELAGGTVHVFDAADGTWLERWLPLGPSPMPAPDGVVVVPDSTRDRIGLKGLMFMRDRPTPVRARLRAAIATAIDRAAVASAESAHEIAAGQRILPPEVLGHQPALSVHPLDVAGATAALAEEGGWTGPPLTLGAFDTDRGEADAIAAALGAIGVPVTVVPFTYAALEANMREPSVDAVIVEHYGTTWGADPYPLLAGLTAAIAEVSWVDPIIQSEIELAAGTADRVAREKHYANIERALLEEASFVPLGFVKLGPTGGLALRTEVRGLVDPSGDRAWRNRAVPPFTQVWLTPGD